MDKQSGLAGVIAGETAICTVGKSAAGLTYRGYEINDLTSKATFEEVAYLLLYGNLPNQSQLLEFQQKLIVGQSLPKAVANILEQLPATAHPMDVLRTACSALGTVEPETNFSQQIDIATRLIPFFASALMYWHFFHVQHKKIDVNSKQPTIAGHILYLLHGGKAPTVADQHALDVSLMLYAEHEFNSSTFAARVCTATLTDFYSAITTGIGTLRGPLHGGANEAAMALISSFNSAAAASAGIKTMLAEKRLIMGFGHRVYKISDPRSDIIKKFAQDDGVLFSVAQAIDACMWQEKRLFPNLDFYSALVYNKLGFSPLMFTPLFVIARTSGWSAHIMEQRANNRLIRPAADYIGPAPRKFIPMDKR